MNTSRRHTYRERPDKFLVAISFAGEQRDLVREIAEAVERRIGVNNVFFDEWFEPHIAGHDADIKLQEIYADQCELAVVCVSERYKGKEWTQAEYEAIRARVMKSRVSSNRRDQLAILPIRVGDGDVNGIPFNAIVPDIRNRSPDQTADLIIERLRLIVPSAGMGVGSALVAPSWPETLPPMLWPMADHNGVREVFAQLMDREAPWRFLPIRGLTETGKSHITRQMLANALRVPELACGRFDFKGTTSLDAEVRIFIQDLGVPLPPASTQLSDRLGRTLDELKQRARPTFLVFDTYEAAGDARDWVEKQLLPCLIRTTWLRVVIAGQRVPEFSGAVWASAARAPLDLVPPPPTDWFEYGKQHRPNLKLADVKTACRLACNKASLLAQLLGPETSHGLH